ncbi:MAG TPA: glycosyltransferase family 2 protein [Acidisoma sp.]|uniref:glycosyltransferase family 2 protein n=1 Tax=Acidisoma sp. TaxID=1872115 RepID=UPI002CC35C68|nr:glycosyltransferase family 2 protein [Acidisoma sp.]HTI02929.1 glycosyltransferase family 2 protein [Acidisoma sp.]
MSDRILLFIPMYNCERQIARVLDQLTPRAQALLSGLIVVDNRSTDKGQAVAAERIKSLQILANVLMNDGNYGLGGSHKVAFEYALAHAFDYVIVLHGDDQGSIEDILPYLERREHLGLDALLGARFMKGSKLEGYSAVRTLGNYGFNMLYSVVSSYPIKDLGSGLNLYRVGALADRWWLKNANDLTFNYHMMLKSIDRGWKMKFFPLTWRESDQVSNVKLVRQSLRVAEIALRYGAMRRKYLANDYSDRPDGAYPSTVVAGHAC